MSTTNEGCKHILKGGPRRGSECGGSLHLGATCWHHDERTVAARNLRNRERAAASKAEKVEYEDALLYDLTTTTGEMKSVGGWGSERHGEFHTARKRWRDVMTRISSAAARTLPSAYKRMSKKAQEYDPGGRYGKCPTEECDCMVDGRYPKVRGRVTSEFSHYFSDEDCSDGSDCEHEEGDVHDCSGPRHVPTVGETISAGVDLEWEIHTVCREIADIDLTSMENMSEYRSLRTGLHKMLNRLNKLESQ